MQPPGKGSCLQIERRLPFGLALRLASQVPRVPQVPLGSRDPILLARSGEFTRFRGSDLIAAVSFLGLQT
jgi:hypothetical protein